MRCSIKIVRLYLSLLNKNTFLGFVGAKVVNYFELSKSFMRKLKVYS